jgi:hypothetical protein
MADALGVLFGMIFGAVVMWVYLTYTGDKKK